MKQLCNSFIKGYEDFKATGIDSRYLRYTQFWEHYKKFDTSPFFQKAAIGKSVEGRPIQGITFGTGPKKLLIWTQMHGNEATATRALLDIFEGLSSNKNEAFRDYLYQNLQIQFVPILNPDGSEYCKRRNALDIDPNRDAKHQSTPEIKALFKVLKSFDPDWCFNMHDQRNLFNVSGTSKPATISFLSPAANAERKKTVNQFDAMRLISCVSEQLSQLNDCGIARFSDEFYPTATGDIIQSMGYRTILIESGGFLNDSNRNVSRKTVFEALIISLCSICSEEWENSSTSVYEGLPMNDTKLFDVLIRGVCLDEKTAVYADVGIEPLETFNAEGELVKEAKIKDIGDLSNYFGYKEYNAENGRLNRSIAIGDVATFSIIKSNKTTISFENGLRCDE